MIIFIKKNVILGHCKIYKEKLIMINISYNFENDEKNAIIEIEKESIGGIEAMEFTDIINSVEYDTKMVIIDINNIVFISSPGIGMILNAYIILKRKDIKLKIINASETIKKLFVMTRIDYVISVEYKK